MLQSFYYRELVEFTFQEISVQNESHVSPF